MPYAKSERRSVDASSGRFALFAAGFLLFLFTSPAFAQYAINWTAFQGGVCSVSGTVAKGAASFVVTVPATPPRKFYRLFKP